MKRLKRHISKIKVNGTNLPSILAEHLDAVTSIENFDPMSKPNITVIDLKTQMKKTKEKRASGLDGLDTLLSLQRYNRDKLATRIKTGLLQDYYRITTGLHSDF